MCDNKENILFTNNISNKLNCLSFEKSFQSQYQYQYQNKSKYQMSNLSVSHENNIICKGVGKEKSNDSIINLYNLNNFNKKRKDINDNSNSHINLEDFSLNTNIYYNNYENYSHKINNENKNEDYNNIDYMKKIVIVIIILLP
jgi:hypothetical protein